MKVLQVLNAIEFSGAEVMLRIASETLITAGAELHAVSAGATRGAFADKLEERGVYVHHHPLTANPKTWWNWYRFLRSERFKVVHVHPERAFLLLILIARLAGARRVVRTVHSNFQFTGLLRIRKVMERWTAKYLLGAKWVTIGPSVEGNERKRFLTRSQRITNWLDESRFYPEARGREAHRQEWGLQPEDRVILTVGSCQPVKRHDQILRAMALVKEPHIKYLQVGNGELFEEEVRLAEELGLSDRVKFVRNLTEPELAYRAADVFVMTSKYEGLSTAAMEAMHCGLVPIFYDVPGLRDFLLNDEGESDNTIGRLIAPGPEQLAAAIRELASDDRHRAQMSKKVHQHMHREYRFEKSMSALIELYRLTPQPFMRLV